MQKVRRLDPLTEIQVNTNINLKHCSTNIKTIFTFHKWRIVVLFFWKQVEVSLFFK